MSWLIPVYETELSLKVCDGISSETKCRYLGVSDTTKQPCCLKLNSDLKQVIDDEVLVYLKRVKINAHVDNLPLGDNCPGVECACDE